MGEVIRPDDQPILAANPAPSPAGEGSNGPKADFAPPEETRTARPTTEGDDPFLQDSVQAQTAFDQAVAEAAAGDEEGAVVYFLRASKLAEAAREWYLAALACQRIGEIFETPAPPYDLERAFRMYRRAAAAYEMCGHFTEARQLSYHLLWTKLRYARQLGLGWWTRLELFVYWALAGFGYRPLRVMATAAVIILGYALLYWALDGVVAVNPSSGESGFLQAVYLSGITFTTIGYGDFVPAPHVRLVALSEGAVGLFVMSFFVVVLANRLRH